MPNPLQNTLANWVQEVLAENGDLSLRQIEDKTGVSYSTVKGLKEGRRVNAETIIRFAVAFEKDVPFALSLAGYDDIAEMWERERGTGEVEPASESEIDPDFPQILAAYQGLSVEMREGVKAMILAAHRTRQRQETTHGKKAE